MVLIFQDVIQDSSLNDFEMAVYAFLVLDVFSPNKKHGYVTSNTIARQMFDTCDDVSDKTKSKINKAIERLIDDGYVKGRKCSGWVYCIETSSFEMEDNRYFIKVEADAMRKIMASKYQPTSVLRQYLLILSGVNYRTKCCIWRYEAFAGVTGKDPKTISAYINALEKMELIYVYSSNRHTSNTYGRYEDREAIESFGKVRMTPNDKRRVAQLRNRGTAITEDEYVNAFMCDDDLFG